MYPFMCVCVCINRCHNRRTGSDLNYYKMRIVLFLKLWRLNWKDTLKGAFKELSKITLFLPFLCIYYHRCFRGKGVAFALTGFALAGTVAGQSWTASCWLFATLLQQ